jgi:uncharacterized protein
MPTIELARTWYSSDDPVHAFDHILRVHALALQIAKLEGANQKIVSAAALIHDADGGDEFASQVREKHQYLSAKFAEKILLELDWETDNIEAVKHCIITHRFRGNQAPESLEAKCLFDADKLDAIGAIGAVRSVAYAVKAGEPIYAKPSKKFLQSFEKEEGERHSSYHEFIFKLSKIRDRMFTESGKQFANERHNFLLDFYKRLGNEIQGNQ